MKKTYLCPVCGFRLPFAAEDFNICPSCGTEFGYSDSGRTYDNLRKNWLDHGAQWSSLVWEKPSNWSPFEQLRNLEPVSSKVPPPVQVVWKLSAEMLPITIL